MTTSLTSLIRTMPKYRAFPGTHQICRHELAYQYQCRTALLSWQRASHHQRRQFLSRSMASYANVSVAQEIDDSEHSKRYAMDAQDARDIFQQAWNKVERHYGLENMRFPKELLFLMGAPGAGKGTLTPSIMQMRQIKNPPIGVSSLLTSPECQRLKNQGLLISDGYVFELLLHAVLLSPNADSGVLIDGFPRTEIQAQMLCFLQEKWQNLSRQFSTTSMHWRYPQANIRLCVLYVDEATSIERQLIRGRQIREHNKVVKQTGQGQMQEERATDFDEQLIRERYHIFRNNYDSLLQLQQTFPLHLIHAYGKIDQVLAKIEHQLQDHEHEKAARPSSELFNMNFALQYLDLHVLPHLLHQPYPNKQHVAPL